MKTLNIKVKQDGKIEVVTDTVPELKTVEALFSNLEDNGVIIDTISPNPALQLILCG